MNMEIRTEAAQFLFWEYINSNIFERYLCVKRKDEVLHSYEVPQRLCSKGFCSRGCCSWGCCSFSCCSRGCCSPWLLLLGLLLLWLLLPVDVMWLLYLWLLPHYVEAVFDFPQLTTVKELQAFLSLLNFNRRSCPASQRCCAPPWLILSRLTFP
jgi:hypothetical protein